jgi:predicted ArsR family transcriptional regulator
MYRALSSKARMEIIKLLYRKPHDIEELAKKLELQPVTIRHHIQFLQEAGLLESVEQRSGAAGRPKTSYKLTKPLPTVAFPERRYMIFSSLLLDYMIKLVGKSKVAEVLSSIGQSMGKQTMDALVLQYKINKWTTKDFNETFVGEYLQDAGTEPEVVEINDNKVVLRLHNCIFSELAQKMPELMCEVAHQQFFQSVTNAMDNDIIHSHTACLGHGDEYCEHIFVWKGNENNKKPTTQKK